MEPLQISRTSDKEYLYHHVAFPPHKLVIASRLEEDDEDDEIAVDPYFFDPSYTLAAATGFSVWEGAIALLSFLRSAENPEAVEFRRRVIENRESVVELGSGTGIAGLGVAALGGDVLLTDVASVCDLTRANVRRNANSSASDNGHAPISKWKTTTVVGRGTASVQTLDWFEPVSQQCKLTDPRSAPIIMAAEVAWLEELVPAFVKTMADLLEPSPEAPTKVCYWAYKERGTEASKIFTTMSHVKRLFTDQGLEVVEIGKEPSRDDPGKHVLVNIVRKRRKEV
ncbi:putative methyltransferase-domain-containing protein [Fimicolochytrium jonesii]|uniref:putative methyltransferase-domain-containing protein n=1 Tax=Fimicolochytrium jonesii TaxID=1396493 RepID=UPI0022FE31D9|nr:putative methyltransferase-domain-containing protein [Fimicolochytrium jonesii]KAI8817339.1 putative methyltransferase-domain-containing protein [Fimicolochytrium jonesii]